MRQPPLSRPRGPVAGILQSFARIVSCGVLAAIGCQPGSREPAATPADEAAAATEVEAATAISRPMLEYREYTGRTSAVNSVEVRARFSGYLLQSPRSQAAPRASVNSGSAGEVLTREADVEVNEGELVE